VRALQTEILKIHDPEKDIAALKRAAEFIRDEEVVAFPTETVYGLGANAWSAGAALKVFAAKGRPADNPLIVHICDMAQLDEICTGMPEMAKKLAAAFWPGPLTMVLAKKQTIPSEVTAGLDTVAVRFPAHPVAHALIKEAGVPIAAPSANLSGKPSPTIFSHVRDDMMGRVAAIIDGPGAEIGVESTVVSFEDDNVRLLRPGGITPEDIHDCLGCEVIIDRAVTGKIDDTEKVSSPGMKYRHYAPSCPLTVVDAPIDSFISYVKHHSDGKKVGILCFDGEENLFPGYEVLTFGNEGDAASQANALFTAIRDLDQKHPDLIFAREAEAGGVGIAVRNRLHKAAGFAIIRPNKI